MDKQQAIEVLRVVQAWRRAEYPYDKPGKIPFDVADYAAALDLALAVLTETKQEETEK